MNSPYAYLLFSHYFSDSCVVAEEEGRVVGTIVGLRPPPKPDTLFVWQIGVAESQRGKGLGRRLLAWLMRENARQGVRYLEATVTPSNEPSQRMFRGFARDVGASCDESLVFPAEVFPDTGERHEEEWLFRIGPVDLASLQTLAEARAAAGGSRTA